MDILNLEQQLDGGQHMNARQEFVQVDKFLVSNLAEQIKDESLDGDMHMSTVVTTTPRSIPMKILEDWLSDNDYICDFHTVTKTELNIFLSNFYETFHNKNATSPKFMCALRSDLCESIRVSPYHRDINIITDSEFCSANQTFDTCCKLYRQMHRFSQRTPQTITSNDVSKLTEYFQNWRKDSSKLLHLVWFMLCYFFGRRHRDEWATMTRFSFVIHYDTNSKRKYLTSAMQTVVLISKCQMVSQRKVFGEPVEIFEYFLSKLTSETTRLFQRPRVSYLLDECWYRGAIGKNALGRFMQMISENAKLSHQYTSLSIKGGTIATLFKAQVIDESATAATELVPGQIMQKLQVPGGSSVYSSNSVPQKAMRTSHGSGANSAVFESVYTEKAPGHTWQSRAGSHIQYPAPTLEGFDKPTGKVKLEGSDKSPSSVPEDVFVSVATSTCTRTSQVPQHMAWRSMQRDDNQVHQSNLVASSSFIHSEDSMFRTTPKPLTSVPQVFVHSGVNITCAASAEPEHTTQSSEFDTKLNSNHCQIVTTQINNMQNPGQGQLPSFHNVRLVKTSSLQAPEWFESKLREYQSVVGAPYSQRLSHVKQPIQRMNFQYDIEGVRSMMLRKKLMNETNDPSSQNLFKPIYQPPTSIFKSQRLNTSKSQLQTHNQTSMGGDCPLEEYHNFTRMPFEVSASVQEDQEFSLLNNATVAQPLGNNVQSVSATQSVNSGPSTACVQPIKIFVHPTDNDQQKRVEAIHRTQATSSVKPIDIQSDMFQSKSMKQNIFFDKSRPEPGDDFELGDMNGQQPLLHLNNNGTHGHYNAATMTMPTTGLTQECLEMVQKDFPWVQFDPEMGSLYCQLCASAGVTIHLDITCSKSMMQAHAATDPHLAAERLNSLLENNSIHDSRLPSSHPQDQLPKMAQFSADSNLPINNGELVTEMNIKEELEDSDSEIAEIINDTEANIDTWPPSVDDEEEGVASESPKDTRVRRFCDHWLLKFPWLQFEREQNLMYCKLCLKYCSNSSHSNTFMKGNSCFKIVSLSAHAGSLDHQMAEEAHELDKPPIEDESKLKRNTISAKQKFLIKKYLSLFPWLLYRADLQRLICELCDRHTRNSLFINACEDIDYKMLDHHRKMRLHVIAEDTEVKSWSIAWDGLEQFGALQGVICESDTQQKDCQRRWTPLFSNTSVAVVGSQKELSAAEDPVEMKKQENNVTSVAPPEDSISSGNGSSEVSQQSPGVSTYWSSHHRYYVRKKPPILPAFGVFQSKWLIEFPWLHYDSQQNIMKCRLCEKYKKSLGFARGVRVFSRSYIVGHISMKKHREALMADGYSVPDYPRERKRRKKSQKQTLIKTEPCSPEINFSDDTGTPSEEHWTDQSSLPESNPCPLRMSVSTASSNITSYESQSTPNSMENKSDDTMFYQDLSPTENSYSASKRRKRCFFPNWAIQFPWVEYHQEGHYMLCTWCVQHGFTSAFTRGCKTFHIDSLRSHDGSVSHQHAAQLHMSRPN